MQKISQIIKKNTKMTFKKSKIWWNRSTEKVWHQKNDKRKLFNQNKTTNNETELKKHTSTIPTPKTLGQNYKF